MYYRGQFKRIFFCFCNVYRHQPLVLFIIQFLIDLSIFYYKSPSFLLNHFSHIISSIYIFANAIYIHSWFFLYIYYKTVLCSSFEIIIFKHTRQNERIFSYRFVPHGKVYRKEFSLTIKQCNDFFYLFFFCCFYLFVKQLFSGIPMRKYKAQHEEENKKNVLPSLDVCYAEQFSFLCGTYNTFKPQNVTHNISSCYLDLNTQLLQYHLGVSSENNYLPGKCSKRKMSRLSKTSIHCQRASRELQFNTEQQN